jgi:hypothetical protein
MLHCWQDHAAHVEETYGFHSEEHLKTYGDDFVSGTCMLQHGHPGPHEFTPDSQIGVTFEGTN